MGVGTHTNSESVAEFGTSIGFFPRGMLNFVARNTKPGNSDQEVRRLVDANVANADPLFSQIMETSVGLATAGFSEGATRQEPELRGSFREEIGHYIYAGDTPLRFATAAYRQKMADRLL